MSLGACLPGLVDQGKLSPDQAAEAALLFDNLQQDFRRQFGDQAAAAMASGAALKALERQASRKRFLAAKAIATRQQMQMDMRGFGGGSGDGPIDPAAGPAFFDGDGRAAYSNVEGRRRAIRGRAHAMIDGILSQHSANMLGQVRNKAQLGDIVRELFGENSGSAVARELAEAWTRMYNGLPVSSTIKGYAKLFRPGSIEDQKIAVRRGLIAEEWSGRTAAQHRFMGEELTGEVSRRLAEGVLRLAGLMRWTQSGRWAFGMEFLATLTEARALGLDGLDPALQRTLTRHGISAADWDAIRAAATVEDGGADWIDPPSLPPALGDKLLEMIHRETDYAVPVPDLSTRALVNSVAPRGTLHGEIIKSAFLGKSFGISVVLMHGRRAIEMAGPQRARYVGGLVIGTTLMGALAIVLKDLASGRDPRAANDTPFVDDKTGEGELSPGFWGQAMLQGGGFGIFGDFVRSAENRAGGGIAGTLAGPLVSDVQSVAGIATAKNPQGAALKELRSQLPGGNLWYLQLGLDRMVGDQLQELIDPDYRKSWRRTEKWAREQGSDLWWSPGDQAPARAPALENITEQPRSLQ